MGKTTSIAALELQTVKRLHADTTAAIHAAIADLSILWQRPSLDPADRDELQRIIARLAKQIDP